MPNTTTYSFANAALVISHPALGQYTATGTGIGTISITPTTDRTAHDVAADGSVMISKVEGANATIALNIQQTSYFNAWLQRAFNYAVQAAPSEWAAFTATLRAPNQKLTISLKGLSFQNNPARQLQAQGQEGAWSMMAAAYATALA